MALAVAVPLTALLGALETRHQRLLSKDMLAVKDLFHVQGKRLAAAVAVQRALVAVPA